jgi:Tfp pilus assembly protein PilN
MIITVCFFGLILGIDKVADLRLVEATQKISSNINNNDYLKIKKYEESIGLAKTKIDIISKIQKDNINWIGVLNKIAEILPTNIVLSSIKSAGYTVTVVGEAENRDALVQMKQGFEGDSCFSNINVPLNDIVLKNNIDFELKFDVDKNCLK